MISLSSLRFPKDLCSAVMFSLFLEIKLQESSSFTSKVLESLFIPMLSFPLLVLNLFSSASSKFCIIFAFLLFFLPTFFLLFGKFLFRFFFSIKKKKSWSSVKCSQEERR